MARIAKLVLLRYATSLLPRGIPLRAFAVGQLLASGISIPFGRHNSSWAWRAPLLLQALPAAINVCFILLLPESPRWLYSRGHKEKATKIMARLHSRDKDVNSPLIRLQIGEIEENISLDGADKRWWDFRTLLRNRASRYRFGMAAIISVWGTFSGNDLITCKYPCSIGRMELKSYRLPSHTLGASWNTVVRQAESVSRNARLHGCGSLGQPQLCQLRHFVCIRLDRYSPDRLYRPSKTAFVR